MKLKKQTTMKWTIVTCNKIKIKSVNLDKARKKKKKGTSIIIK